MTTWIALLRGVNVGGITVRSADLADLFRRLGFDGVQTFLASGNVRFETDAVPSPHSGDAPRAGSARADAAEASARADLTTRIQSALREHFGYEAWIVLVTRAELERAIDGFPFDAGDAARQPWVVFCSDHAAHEELVAAAASLDPVVDPVAAGTDVVYWNPVKGTSVDTPFARLLSKPRYKASTTNRNLRTLVRIAR